MNENNLCSETIRIESKFSKESTLYPKPGEISNRDLLENTSNELL